MAQIVICYDPRNKISGANKEAKERWDLSEVLFGLPDKMTPKQIENIALHLVRLLLTEAAATDAAVRAPYYPPVSPEELENCRAYEHCFDRVVVTKKGVYARRYDGTWIELRPGWIDELGASPPAREWPVQINTSENKTPVFKPGDRVATEIGVIKLVEDYRSDPQPSIKFVGGQSWYPLSLHKFRLIDQG